jgi:hypothetical protein
MEAGSPTTPEEAAKLRCLGPDMHEQYLVDNLAAHGVDTRGLDWLSSDQASSVVQRWMERGAQRYGHLAFIPAVDSNVCRGEFDHGELPTWLETDLGSREVFASFTRPASERGPRRIARSTFGFIIDNLVSLACADGDGFAVVTSDLESVLLVNVPDSLESRLEIDAWGDFVRELPQR